MKTYALSYLFLPLMLAAGCTNTPKVDPLKTQLQIRAFQTRVYSESDHKMVLKAMINVLQDMGFIIQNANTELGLLTATKEVDVEDKGQALWSTFWSGYYARYSKSSIIECTANVNVFGEQTRVRANFRHKILDNHGAVSTINQIEEEAFYQDFFAKVDKAIFLQKENL